MAPFLLIVTLFASFCLSQNYIVLYSWTGAADCSGSYSSIYVSNNTNPGTCSNAACACGVLNGVSVCARSQCNVTTIPADPPSAVAFGSYVNPSCSGEVLFYTAATSGTCYPTNIALTTSSRISCSGSVFTQNDFSANGNCAGTPSGTTSYNIGGSTLCFAAGGNSFFAKCGNVCFHKDSQIKYHDKEISFASLSAPENDVPCVIPHVVKSDGVKISTSCEGALRLTHGHLVMTQHGWRKAGLIEVGDKIYSKVHSREEECTVTKIETELNQEYFGLNCEDSHVLSDGYWVSTFGETHGLPAAWMKIMSKIVGVRHASALGDKIANFAYSWALI